MPQHLLAQVANRVPPRFGGESPSDVFLMVKAFVSDTELCQSILVVWPGSQSDTTVDKLSRLASNQVPGFVLCCALCFVLCCSNNLFAPNLMIPSILSRCGHILG